MRRGIFSFLVFLTAAICARADSPTLLQEAVRKWAADEDHWAYTQHVRLMRDNRVTQERVERYDPSLPADRQWQLLAVAGKAPTAAQVKSWQKKKERELRQRNEKALRDYFDFEHASVVEESADAVRYNVPLFPDQAGRYPLEKLAVAMTVRKERGTIDELTAGLKESFRMALGAAQVTDLGIKIRFRTIDEQFAPQPDLIFANGAMRVGRFFSVGGQAQLAWSDFKRVQPYRDHPQG
jgi:hypothetical protein